MDIIISIVFALATSFGSVQETESQSANNNSDQISTADGPRYIVKSDGVIYD